MNKLILFLIVLSSLTQFSIGQSKYGGFIDDCNTQNRFRTRVNIIFQDSKGYIWVGAANGLVRYDGINFEEFERNKSGETILSDVDINTIAEDPNEYVFWVGTSIGGINRVDVANNKYEHFYIEPDSANHFGFVKIISVCTIGENELLVGTYSQGLYYFNCLTKKFKKFEYSLKNPNKLPVTILKITKQKNFVWVCTMDGVLQFNLNGEFIKMFYFNYERFTDTPIENPIAINNIVEKDDDNILFLSYNWLYQYNWKNAELKRVFNGKSRLNNICIDDNGGYWIGTKHHGLYYYNPISKNIKSYRQEDCENSISNNWVTSLALIQNNQILFIGTANGISKYDYRKTKFKQFDIKELSGNNVSMIFTLLKDSKNSYWVGSYSNLYRKKDNDSLFKRVDLKEEVVALRATEDNYGKLWITTKTGIVKYDILSDKYKRINIKYKNYPLNEMNYIGCISPVKNDTVYTLCRRGILEIDVKTDAYNFVPFDENMFEIQNYRFTDIEYSKDGNFLWFSNRRGELGKYYIDTKKYEKIQTRNLVNQGLKPCIIMDIHVDEKGLVWMATYGNGLLIYNPETNTISEELAYGMLDSYVYGIVENNGNDFWISSNKGLVYINADTKERVSYDKSDGTYCHEFNEIAFYKAPDGNILFGGIDGFIEFNSDSMYYNDYKATVDIRSAFFTHKKNGKDKTINKLSHLNDTTLIIKGGKSSINFNISMLNYSKSENNTIEWKLEGFDDIWNVGSANEVIKYNNLSEGEYTLLVKGKNDDNIESANTISLKLKVKATFFRSTFFRILLIVLLSIVVFSIFRIRIYWFKRQEKILQYKVNEKTKELIIANEELESAKEELYSQKTELEIHRNHLEDIVKVRTKEFEEAKLKAEESDRLKTSFLANLSHEIRTPMNAIIGFSSLLNNEKFSDDQRSHFLNVIRQSSESLLVLINDIIDISRIETGNILLVSSKTNINELVKETLDELVFEEKEKNVRFLQAFELNQEDKTIDIDRYRLKQIISNLLRNAFKFTKEGYVKLLIKSIDYKGLKELGFSLEKCTKSDFKPLLFIVEDTGIGIEKDDFSLIFQPFQKAQNGEKFYKGMGLGLSIVSQLVTLFGGEIKVESIVEKGTKFYFYVDLVYINKIAQIEPDKKE